MTTTQNETSGRKRRLTYWIVGVAVLVVAGVGFNRLRPKGNQQELSDDIPTFQVQQGPLTISVTESGTVRPREQLILKNEVEGQTSIIYLIEEGKEVKKGDLLIELDSSSMLDTRVNQQIMVYNAEAAFINARETMEVVKNQAKADIDKAALDLEFAKQDLNQYKAGDFPKLENEAKAKITLAEETLQNASNTVTWSKKLFEEKYLSETELKKDQLTAQKATLDLDLANADLVLLKNFTYKRNIATYESNLKQTSMTLERTLRKAAADVAQAEAQLKAKEAEFKQQSDKLAKIEKQIQKTKIIAPMDGRVIYASSTRSDFHGNESPLDEGQTVRERQELIYLPTTSSYDTEIKVHESSLDKISMGQSVVITVDALPGRTFTGRVAQIAPLPDPQSRFMNPDLKVYKTTIEIDGDIADLRNGMSCKAEIIVDRFEKAFFIPIQAVMRVGGRTVAYVREGEKFKMRPIKIGLDNNRMVQVTEGLKLSETVLMAPPLADAETNSETHLGLADKLTSATQASRRAADVARSQNAGNKRGGTGAGTGAITGAGTGTGASDGTEGRTRGKKGRRGGTGTGAPDGTEGADRSLKMTPEQRDQMQQRFQKMSPEERDARRKSRPAPDGAPGGAASPAGAPGGRSPAGGGRE